jgi:hypothetical protein
MNEAAGTSVMGDSSGHGMTGSIGAHIQTHQTFDGAVGYRWVFRKPEEPPADPQRLVQVANRSALNPGTGTYVVTIRMRTTQDFGNIVQKGQAGAKGGYWKLENPHGVVPLPLPWPQQGRHQCRPAWRSTTGNGTSSAASVRPPG